MNTYKLNKLKPNELKTIGHYTGYVCIIMSVLMIVPVVCGLIYHDPERFVYSFIFSAIISFISGAILIALFGRKQSTTLSFKGALIFVLSIWGIIAIYCGLPYILSGELGIFDSFFEAMSGITTTGFSLIPEETYPYSVTMWKALTQWFGGLGIIVLLLAIVPSSVSLKRLFFAEGRTEQMTPNVRHTTMIFLKLYASITSLGIILYLLLGLDLYEAICFTFTAVATGGFSIYSSDTHIFNSLAIQIVTMFLMILGSTNFVIHYRIIKGDTRHLLKDIELRAMFIIIAIATLLIMISLYSQGYYNHDILVIFRHSIFQVISVMSSTGFVSQDIYMWPQFSFFLLLLLTFIGGSICSTSGGIKLYNIVILFKSIWWEVEEMMLPKNTIKPKKINHDKRVRDISNKNIKTILIFVVSYILLFLLSTFIILFYCNDFITAFTVAALSIGNTGISVGYISASMPFMVKLILIIDFWVGRISVWPLFLGVLYMINRAESKIKSLNNE
ncbi:potassium transporter TrkG [Methanosphaera sp.]|uniref:TrkH family potassium uptake protein n=1 Tax=Methanosphaera sp. TaxID=2666342 RepID=UPI0025E448DD|nr:potassium transporter TrkG [Methanosphaera sp.]